VYHKSDFTLFLFVHLSENKFKYSILRGLISIVRQPLFYQPALYTERIKNKETAHKVCNLVDFVYICIV